MERKYRFYGFLALFLIWLLLSLFHPFQVAESAALESGLRCRLVKLDEREAVAAVVAREKGATGKTWNGCVVFV